MVVISGNGKQVFDSKDIIALVVRSSLLGTEDRIYAHLRSGREILVHKDRYAWGANSEKKEYDKALKSGKQEYQFSDWSW